LLYQIIIDSPEREELGSAEVRFESLSRRSQLGLEGAEKSLKPFSTQ
jgi:hypothetical protein